MVEQQASEGPRDVDADGHSNARPTFDDLYRAFEDTFRGSRETIIDRMRVYHPLYTMQPADYRAKHPALDLGCGRGEWLELLRNEGWAIEGVDSNEGMASDSPVSDHVVIGDALAHLRSKPNSSLGVVSAFHVVEHITTDALLTWLAEIKRVLAPGGLLLLETPNPESLNVSTWTFLMDPTHVKPVPPALLKFLVDQIGFAGSQVLRLNGPARDQSPMGAADGMESLYYSGPDYAVVACRTEADDPTCAAIERFVAANSQRSPADLGPLVAALRRTEAELASTQRLVRTLVADMERVLIDKGWSRS